MTKNLNVNQTKLNFIFSKKRQNFALFYLVLNIIKIILLFTVSILLAIDYGKCMEYDEDIRPCEPESYLILIGIYVVVIGGSN